MHSRFSMRASAARKTTVAAHVYSTAVARKRIITYNASAEDFSKCPQQSSFLK